MRQPIVPSGYSCRTSIVSACSTIQAVNNNSGCPRLGRDDFTDVFLVHTRNRQDIHHGWGSTQNEAGVDRSESPIDNRSANDTDRDWSRTGRRWLK